MRHDLHNISAESTKQESIGITKFLLRTVAMTDLTGPLSDILVQKHSAPAISPPGDYTSKLDSFLHEAYQINRSISSLLGYLRNIRTPYLSTAPAARQKRTANDKNVRAPQLLGSDIPEQLNDSQREAIDSETSSVRVSVTRA